MATQVNTLKEQVGTAADAAVAAAGSGIQSAAGALRSSNASRADESLYDPPNSVARTVATKPLIDAKVSSTALAS